MASSRSMVRPRMAPTLSREKLVSSRLAAGLDAGAGVLLVVQRHRQTAVRSAALTPLCSRTSGMTTPCTIAVIPVVGQHPVHRELVPGEVKGEAQDGR